jgi:hypothetical protein
MKSILHNRPREIPRPPPTPLQIRRHLEIRNALYIVTSESTHPINIANPMMITHSPLMYRRILDLQHLLLLAFQHKTNMAPLICRRVNLHMRH